MPQIIDQHGKMKTIPFHAARIALLTHRGRKVYPDKNTTAEQFEEQNRQVKAALGKIRNRLGSRFAAVGERGKEYLDTASGEVISHDDPRRKQLDKLDRKEPGRIRHFAEGGFLPQDDKFQTDDKGAVRFDDTTVLGQSNVNAAMPGIGDKTPDIFGRPSPTVDFLKKAGSGIAAGIAGAVKSVPAIASGLKTAFSNTIGNNGPEGSGAPTYSDDPYNAGGIAATTGIAQAASIPSAAHVPLPSHTPGADLGIGRVMPTASLTTKTPPAADDPAYYNQGRGGSADDAMATDIPSIGSMTISGVPGARATIGIDGQIQRSPVWDKERNALTVAKGGIGGTVNSMPAAAVNAAFDRGKPRATSPVIGIDYDPSKDTSTPIMEKREDGSKFQRGIAFEGDKFGIGAATAGWDPNEERVTVGKGIQQTVPLSVAKSRGLLSPEQQAYYDTRDVARQKVANEAAEVAGKNSFQQGLLGIDAPYKQAMGKAELMKSEGVANLNAAHAAYYNAISDPRYVNRQLEIAQMKEGAEKQKAEAQRVNHVLNSMGADLSIDNVNLLNKYEADLKGWDARAAKAFAGNTPSQQAWANSFRTYIHADPKRQAELAKNDTTTQMMLGYVRRRDPSILQKPVMPALRAAKQLGNMPPIGQEG